VKKPVLIKELIQRILKVYNLEKPLRRHSSVFIWNDIIENGIRKKTKAVSYKDGNLFVEVESSTLRNELLFKKEGFIQELNKRVGEKAVKNIVFINRRSFS
jgi:hypothetical protein